MELDQKCCEREVDFSLKQCKCGNVHIAALWECEHGNLMAHAEITAGQLRRLTNVLEASGSLDGESESVDISPSLLVAANKSGAVFWFGTGDLRASVVANRMDADACAALGKVILAHPVSAADESCE